MHVEMSLQDVHTDLRALGEGRGHGDRGGGLSIGARGGSGGAPCPGAAKVSRHLDFVSEAKEHSWFGWDEAHYELLPADDLVHLELALEDGSWSSDWRPLCSEPLEELLERCKEAPPPLQLPPLGVRVFSESKEIQRGFIMRKEEV